jgi:hypothetical protein
MALNHTKFTWTAPTKNVDGTPITYALDYTFYANKVGDQPVAILTTPGSLNPQGQYEAPIADMPFFVPGFSYETRLTARQHDNQANESAKTNPLTFALTDTTPQSPLDLAVS